MEIGKKYGMYIALAVVFGMMLLYGWPEARAFISGLVNIVVGPFAALGLPFFALVLIQIGRASCRERVCQYV